jgi:prepilin-type N-terminal cleavage/methylation domain-containing protein
MIMTHCSPSAEQRAPRGFTLVELLITLLLLATVVATLTTVLYTASRSKTSSANSIEASQAGRVAIDMIGRDLRSAGYGADLDYTSATQPPIAYIDSQQVLINENLQPWPDSLGPVHAPPLAYKPGGSPNPFPLVGTAWTPPARYGTGAETVRWTLDLNNDGQVNASDQADANAVDAQHTRNPDDFELVRQVYGDSTGGSPGNNGGTTERIALVRRPGSGVAPMFTVYLKGSTTPWDWSNGPVPPAELRNIERVTVQITAPSGKPDWRGHYSESHFRTEVNSLRNTPDFGVPEYGVDGYVYEDQDRDSNHDAGEPGIPGTTVRLGMYSTISNASGYFFFSAPAGTYRLKHTPAAGYQAFSTPDSFSVTVPPPATRSFGDIRLAGGTIRGFVFVDANNNAAYDTGERGRANAKLTLNPGARVAYTATTGHASLFADAGSYTLAVTPPDSFTVTTPNPITGTINNGDSLSNSFGIYRALVGTIKGKVFLDLNRNGVLDAGETGIGKVWVGVTPDGGLTVPGYAWTDSLTGDYSITVPINDPPHTQAYSVMCIPPAGRFPTGTTSINGIWLQDCQTLTGKNFGMAAYTVIPLTANRVLCLASKDLIESDWNGTHTENARQDQDIILGSDTGGSDQVSVWFNQYNSTPYFDTNPTYARTAPNAVLAMAVDSLDQDPSPFRTRPDLVTGTKITASGNFFVWFNQGSKNNEGYFPSTYSTGQNYKTTDQGDVQAVVTLDCAGGAGADMPDIVVGTKSPTANQGTLEVWKSNNAVTPTFTRDETHTTLGAAGSSIGEVSSIVAADIDGDGKKDLVVGTRTGSYSGQILFLKGANKSTTPHFTYQGYMSLASDAVTALAVTDVDGDGQLDIVAGTQSGLGLGHVQYFRCTDAASFAFVLTRSVNAPGIVTALLAADLGGSSRNDIVIGWRQDTGSYVGGVRIYYTDAGTLPNLSVDPSAGGITNFVPALTSANFNYGVIPAASPPFLTDFAVGVKISSSTGALVVYVR